MLEAPGSSSLGTSPPCVGSDRRSVLVQFQFFKGARLLPSPRDTEDTGKGLHDTNASSLGAHTVEAASSTGNGSESEFCPLWRFEPRTTAETSHLHIR